MSGMMISATRELTIAPNAAPMITPTARSTTLPRIANFLNSSSIGPSPLECQLSRATTSVMKIRLPRAANSVDQTGVHHGFANRSLRLFAGRDHRQPQRVGAFADQRQRIFDRRRTGFNEQVDVQRGE